jgi:ariadne-1
LCLKPWKGHNDFYSCNRYEKAQKKQEKKPVAEKKKKAKWQRLEEEREKQRQQLQRFMHYYERYASYDNATKLEKQIKEKALQRMAALTNDQSTKAEVQFVRS